MLAGLMVVGLTACGVIAGLLVPGLAGRTAPHPALTGSLDDAVSILAGNARLLAVPFGLAVIGLGRSGGGRVIGDAVALILSAVSTLQVGVAVGRWGGQLLPFIPNLPCEWAALVVAISVWILARRGRPTLAQIAALAAISGVLLSAATVLEVWGTPHRHPAVLVAHGGSRRGTGG